MTEEEKELIKESGREIAQHWLSSAVRDAENPEQMRNQMFALQVAAAHIFATCVYNEKIQAGGDPLIFLEKISEGIKKEYLYVEEAGQNGDVGYLKVKNAPKKH